MFQSFWKQLIIILLFVFLFNAYFAYLAQQGTQSAEISYSRFRSELAVDNIRKITIKGTSLKGEFRSKVKVSEQVQGKAEVREVAAFITVLPPIADQTLMADLTARNVDVTAASVESSFFVTAPMSVLSIVPTSLASANSIL